MTTLALIVTDEHRGRLGHRPADRLQKPLADAPVFVHTMRRSAAIPGVDALVVVHPRGQDPAALVAGHRFNKPVHFFAHDAVGDDPASDYRRTARAWATDAWRGGLGGATVWDELLPAAPLHAAMQKFGGTSAVLVGGDWCVLDPVLTGKVLAIHHGAPDRMRLAFTQAPPGLAGVAVHGSVLAELATSHGWLAQALTYNPRAPGVDPVGKEACLPIEPAVRDGARRLIFDTPEAIARLQSLADALGPCLGESGGEALVRTLFHTERTNPAATLDHPPTVVLELTTRRAANGLITPQHAVTITRPDADLAWIADLAPQVAGLPVLLGGAGDPLLHPRWREVVAMIKPHCSAVGVRSDLLGGEAQADALIDAEVDLVIANLHADSPASYAGRMGLDGYQRVVDAMDRLVRRRHARGRTGWPWVVPALSKCIENVAEMETFFERWWQLLGHALIERYETGGRGAFALREDRSPVPMDGPPRPADVHRRKHTLTILSDGRVTPCSQDWLGRAAVGDLRVAPLRDLWRSIADRPLPRGWSWNEAPVCGRCFDWLSTHAAPSDEHPAQAA